MALNYHVSADIVDIRSHRPKAGDTFLVDTNVWLWMSYTKVPPSVYQAELYPPFVNQAIKIKATLLRCGLSFAELSHSIERAERQIYIETHRMIGTKLFRHTRREERKTVVAEIKAAWGAVQTMATPLDVTIDEHITTASLERLHTQPLDGYDLFIAEALEKSDTNQILTDDGDFCCIPGICMFTANRNVIKAAASQGKLVNR